jgi:hypothetical protein
VKTASQIFLEILLHTLVHTLAIFQTHHKATSVSISPQVNLAISSSLVDNFLVNHKFTQVL